jgi:hypothetical protein
MKVTLETYGGFAAGIRRPARTVDTASLSAPQAAELVRLVAAASSGRSDDSADPGRARDAMSYEITVEDGGRSITLTGSDTSMSPSFRALRQWIEAHVD